MLSGFYGRRCSAMSVSCLYTAFFIDPSADTMLCLHMQVPPDIEFNKISLSLTEQSCIHSHSPLKKMRAEACYRTLTMRGLRTIEYNNE